MITRVLVGSMVVLVQQWMSCGPWLCLGPSGKTWLKFSFVRAEPLALPIPHYTWGTDGSMVPPTPSFRQQRSVTFAAVSPPGFRGLLP